MNYQKKLDSLIERALSNIVQNKKTIISEQDPPSNSKGGFVFTPETPVTVTTTNATGKTTKPKTVKKVVKKDVEEPKPSTTNVTDSSTTWQPPAKDSTAYQKALQQKVQKYYDKDNPEHDDAWNGVMVYGALIGLSAFLLGKGYVKYKAVTDPEWAQTSGFYRNMYGQPFWPGWIRWFGGQQLRDIQDLKKFLNLERERGNITLTEYDDFIRALNKSDRYIKRAKTFNRELKDVKAGVMTMEDLIERLPKAYQENEAFTSALLKYDDEVLSYGRPGGRRVVRGTAGELTGTAPGYSFRYTDLIRSYDEMRWIDWNEFVQTYGDKYGELTNISALHNVVGPSQWISWVDYATQDQLREMRKAAKAAIKAGEPIPVTEYGVEQMSLNVRDGRFLGPDGKLVGQPTATKPAVTVNMHAFASSTILRNLETSVKNNVPCIEFHLKFQTAGKENLKKFLMSDEMTTIAGESYSSAEANAIIRKLESDGSNIVLPKKYTEPGATIPDMNQWTNDMKEIGLRPVYRNDSNRKRQIAYAEIYKILRKGL